MTVKRLAAAFLTLALALPLAAQQDAALARAERILREVPLVDGHNDLPWQFRARTQNRLGRIDLRQEQSRLERPLHTDIPRMRRGLVGAQFWSVWVPTELKGPDAVQATLEQIDVVHRLGALYPDTFVVARTAAEIEQIHKSGKIASLIGVEGGHSINASLGALRQFHLLGARYMTLTHGANVAWADASTAEPKHNGLTPFGRRVVTEMNRLGMMVDLSHVSPKTMHDALDATLAPVIFSHSSARAVTDHPRNVPDDVLLRVKANGGVVMITFVPGFISTKVLEQGAAREAEQARLKAMYEGQPERVNAALEAWDKANPRVDATVADAADHIEHIIRIAGEDHVGIGGDFDGIGRTPTGLTSVADYPNLFAELIRRGHGDQRLKKIAGLNLLRVMAKVEAVAAGMKSTPPADVRIEDLDEPVKEEQQRP
ncbi:MAG: dipeptidase [Thermoanaerobaculia bacterium]